MKKRITVLLLIVAMVFNSGTALAEGDLEEVYFVNPGDHVTLLALDKYTPNTEYEVKLVLPSGTVSQAVKKSTTDSNGVLKIVLETGSRTKVGEARLTISKNNKVEGKYTFWYKSSEVELSGTKGAKKILKLTPVPTPTIPDETENKPEIGGSGESESTVEDNKPIENEKDKEVEDNNSEQGTGSENEQNKDSDKDTNQGTDEDKGKDTDEDEKLVGSENSNEDSNKDADDKKDQVTDEIEKKEEELQEKEEELEKKEDTSETPCTCHEDNKDSSKSESDLKPLNNHSNPKTGDSGLVGFTLAFMVASLSLLGLYIKKEKEIKGE